MYVLPVFDWIRLFSRETEQAYEVQVQLTV